LVRGNPAVTDEISFEDFDEALQKLRIFLSGFRKRVSAEQLPQPLGLPSHRIVLSVSPIPDDPLQRSSTTPL
jgi:hypothetical protein